MPRNARLRLAQDIGKIGNGDLGLGQERENPQPRRLAGGLQGAVERLERKVGRVGCHVGHVAVSSYRPPQGPYKDMFIPLSDNFKAGVGNIPRPEREGLGAAVSARDIPWGRQERP